MTTQYLLQRILNFFNPVILLLTFLAIVGYLLWRYYKPKSPYI